MGFSKKKILSFVLSFTLALSVFYFEAPKSYALSYITSGYQYVSDFIGNVKQGIADHMSSSYNNSILGRYEANQVKYYSSLTAGQETKSFYGDRTINRNVYANGNTLEFLPVTVEGNTVNNQHYDFKYYDVDARSYKLTNNFNYSPDYRTFYTTNIDETNNYEYNTYITDNYTYISYIYEYPEHPNEDKYFEVYYELPDGRNSYNLTIDDLKGVVFTYDVDLYETSLVDDNLLGLWHLDGDINDSFNPNNTYSTSANVLNDFYDGYFDGALKLSGRNNYLTLNVEGDLSQPFTLEWIQYDYSSNVDIYDNSIVFHDGLLVYDEYDFAEWHNYRGHINQVEGYHSNLSQYNFCALVFDGEDYLFFINGVKDENFEGVSRNVFLGSNFCTYEPNMNKTSFYYSSPFLDIGQDSITFKPFIYQCHTWNVYKQDRIDISQGILAAYNLPSRCLGSGLYRYWHNVNVSICRYNWLIDEIRLSAGVLYDGNYNVRREPFDIGFAYTVPNNPESGKVYIQSQTNVSRFQIGGVRSPNPLEGEVFISTVGNVGEMAIQYRNGMWQYVPAAVYFNGEFRDIAGFDFVNLMFLSGESASGGSFVVEVPEEVTSLLEKIDQRLAEFFSPLKPVDDTIPLKAPDAEDGVEPFHLSDFFILLIYFILFIQILGDFVMIFINLSDWMYHLWAIEALPGPLAGNEYFMGVYSILHGGTAFGLPEPILIFGVVTLHDFMVILFEIAFIGVMVAFYRKKLTNFKFPTLR